MEPSGWVPVQLALRASPGVHYSLDVQIQDVHGVTVHRRLELVGVGPGRRGVAGADLHC
jgi:hypothetical protein